MTMSDCASPHYQNARRAQARRAFSLIELTSVLMIIGLLGSMAFLRFGDTTYNTTSTDGFVRALVLDLRQARRRTISIGDDHYVLLSRTSGVVTSYTLYRDPGGGAYVVDRTVQVPTGATVTTATDQWTFDFDGSVAGGTGTGTIVVTGPFHTWTITVYLATGAVKSAKVST
jgi:prepilin-type N-terminal cleavage/methylation domain-containing protein